MQSPQKGWLTEAEIKEKVMHALKILSLENTGRKYPSDLSGGMKKRVAIARSLAMNPDLILYDEPTAELDPVTTDELANTILKLKETTKNTTVIVTHDPEAAGRAHADQPGAAARVTDALQTNGLGRQIECVLLGRKQPRIPGQCLQEIGDLPKSLQHGLLIVGGGSLEGR